MKNVGTGTRALNFFIDTMLIFILTYAAFKIWNWYVIFWHFPYYNFWLFFAVILVVYYTLFESIGGRTPGKWLSFSKVIDSKNKKPSFVVIFIRTLIRLTMIDMFFLPFLNKTLHDYLSKTEVVEV
jgi:uncharacterized RDD family membrane protein YckC